jgi:hypothetical protein
MWTTRGLGAPQSLWTTRGLGPVGEPTVPNRPACLAVLVETPQVEVDAEFARLTLGLDALLLALVRSSPAVGLAFDTATALLDVQTPTATLSVSQPVLELGVATSGVDVAAVTSRVVLTVGDPDVGITVVSGGVILDGCPCCR